MSASMKEILLAAAETRVRARGFHAVSFRDLASDAGIKSASVHYHFPTKADLGMALVERYQSRFEDALAQIDRSDYGSAVSAFVDLYANALIPGEAICLCAMLAAESNGLPEAVTARVRSFFEMNAQWLEALAAEHPEIDSPLPSLETVSTLEGAMIVSAALGTPDGFDTTANRIKKAAQAAR